ncbi:BamA/TamA family outer membrane protein [Ruegeria pomeroyi]|uniref:BamA/TamA family outer membrane protein n=1 Tax=Ruegeria pomeroyi TaxID=89184 RepID=A0A9Q3WJN2_9RHOB|nr:BamA/TamA family outer membrane protein [Ruegeria pomeroyi]MCE8536662.1 BamA/TamA family outer membrane protein [Ruegeria pomeroyi]
MKLTGPLGVLLRGLATAAIALLPTTTLALEAVLTAPGASEELQDRLRQSSSALSAPARGQDSPLELLSAALSDYRTLVQVLYDAGHFSPVIHIRLDGREAAGIDPFFTPEKIGRIEIAVDPGPAFRFGTARVEPLSAGTRLPEGFASGQPATTGAIRDAAQTGISGWREAGYAKVRIGDQRIRVRHAPAELDADIRLLPGPKLRFGQMYVQGDSDVTPKAIARIAGFPSGEVYSPDQVQRVGTRLRRTGAFALVSVTEHETPNPDGTLDFDATFEDLPKRRITFGAELSSRDGLDLSAIWIHRNLFGAAERLRLEATVRNIGGTEDIDGRIGFRLDRPDRLGPDDSIFYIGEAERRNRTHYQITRAVLGIGARRTFSDTLYAEAGIGLSYGDADDAYGTGRKFRYLGLRTALEWDERDNKVSATRGFYINAGLDPFIGLSGTKSGARLTADGRAYWDFNTEGRFVLAGRLQLGSVFGPSQSDISPELLFFSGGAGTVRGQPYESLGLPVGGNTAGGKSFVGLSTEIRGKVTEKISLVGFYDFGSVGASSFITSGSDSHAGAGLGIRYDLGGLGPLRLDLAYPTSGKTDGGLQFYLGIGQAF